MNCCKCSAPLKKDIAISVTFSYVRPEMVGGVQRRVQAPATKMEYCAKCGPKAIEKFKKEMKPKLLDKLKVG